MAGSNLKKKIGNIALTGVAIGAAIGAAAGIVSTANKAAENYANKRQEYLKYIEEHNKNPENKKINPRDSDAEGSELINIVAPIVSTDTSR